MNHTIEREGKFYLLSFFSIVFVETVNDRHRVDEIGNGTMAVDIPETVVEILVVKYSQLQNE